MVVSRILQVDPDNVVLPEDEPMRKSSARLMNQTQKEQPELNVPNVLFLPAPREILQQLSQQRQKAEQEEAEKNKLAEIEKALAEKRPDLGEEAKEFGLRHGIGRNDLCPCGSGRKFKKCCMKV